MKYKNRANKDDINVKLAKLDKLVDSMSKKCFDNINAERTKLDKSDDSIPKSCFDNIKTRSFKMKKFHVQSEIRLWSKKLKQSANKQANELTENILSPERDVTEFFSKYITQMLELPDVNAIIKAYPTLFAEIVRSVVELSEAIDDVYEEMAKDTVIRKQLYTFLKNSIVSIADRMLELAGLVDRFDTNKALREKTAKLVATIEKVSKRDWKRLAGALIKDKLSGMVKGQTEKKKKAA